mgnify:CR=1 FL=1
MIEPISYTDDIGKVIPEKELNNTPYYLGDDLERSPNGDTFNDKKKKTRRIIFSISGIVALTAIVIGALCYSKGKSADGAQKKFGERMRDGWKNLWRKGEQKTAEAKETKPPEKPSGGNDNNNANLTEKTSKTETLEKPINPTRSNKPNSVEGTMETQATVRSTETNVPQAINEPVPEFINNTPLEIANDTKIIKIDNPAGVFEECCERCHGNYKRGTVL